VPEAETVELRDYLRVLRRYAWVIAMVTVVAVITSGVLSYKVIKPTYQATATAIVLQRSNPSVAATNVSAQQLYQTLSQTYADLATSPDVLAAAARAVGLKPTQLTDQVVTATPVTGTNLLTVQVTAASARTAAAAADAVVIALARRVVALEHVNVIALANRAPVPDQPVSPRPKVNMGIAAVLGLLVGVALAFLLEYMDSTLRGPEDVQRLLGLPVLGEIPVIETPRRPVVLPGREVQDEALP
jgi:capsular polysaccharide biosynthesis protein